MKQAKKVFAEEKMVYIKNYVYNNNNTIIIIISIIII